MKRVVCTFSTTVLTATVFTTTILTTTLALTLVTVRGALAQSIPHVDRLSPSKLQQFARDLTPSSAQDFFNAGQAQLEHEIRLLSRPRSTRDEHLLTVRKDAQVQPTDQPEPPVSSPRH